jgi:hypothetical protein
MPDGELLAEIRDVLADSPFVGEGHPKVWARIRRRGVRTSRQRVLRLTREAGLLAAEYEELNYKKDNIKTRQPENRASRKPTRFTEQGRPSPLEPQAGKKTYLHALPVPTQRSATARRVWRND